MQQVAVVFGKRPYRRLGQSGTSLEDYRRPFKIKTLSGSESSIASISSSRSKSRVSIEPETRQKPAATAPPGKARISIAKSKRQRTVYTEQNSTQETTFKGGLTNSTFGKRSVDDIWEDLFQIKGVEPFTDSSYRPHTRELSSRMINDSKHKSGMDISNRRIEGTSLANNEKLIALIGAQKLNRRVASVNIPGMISKFDQALPRDLKTSKEPDPKNRLEKDESVVNEASLEIGRDKEKQEGSKDSKANKDSIGVNTSRRYCIVDNFLYNSTRPLTEKLEALLDLFKSTLLTCEVDFQEKINFDTIKTKIFSSIGFISSKGFDKKAYLCTCQSVIEMLISHLRSVDVTRSMSKKSVVLSTHILKNDLVFSAIRKIVNFETMLVLLELYFKVLLAMGSIEKAELVSKISLSLAYIADLLRFKIEAYNMLGQVFERRRQPEIALLCFTRSMQLCIEVGDHAREMYMCDKMGLQLYYLNEMELARLYHVRFLVSFQEPALTNAIILSKEILVAEKKQFMEYYLLRESNSIDKYRAADVLLSLKASPFDEFLRIEKDEKGNPRMLQFIEMMLSIQRREMQSLKLKKVSIINDSVFGKKNREYQRHLKEQEASQKVEFTPAGMHMLIDSNEYVPKISTTLLDMNLKVGLRVTHQKDFNAIFNYINQTSVHPQDFETAKTQAAELSRRNSVEDMLLFLTRARYFVMRKINEVSNIKASKYHRMLRPTFKPIGGSKSSLLHQ